MPADLATACIANGVQRFANSHALGIGFGEGFFQGEFFGKYPRAHHARGKARAFFVGPHHHFNWRLGLDVEVIEGTQHFDPGQHAETAIKLAARRLSVDVAAGHHWRQVRIKPRSTGKDIAHGIDADGATGVFAPAYKDVPGLTVEVGQGQAAHAAFDRGAQLGQFHQ